jgi:hypothetical protein
MTNITDSRENQKGFSGGDSLPPLAQTILDRVLSVQGKSRRFATPNDFWVFPI